MYIGHCLDPNEMVEECASEHCITDTLDDGNGGAIQFTYCLDEDDTRTTGLRFTLAFNKESGDRDQAYRFVCNYDNCNNQSKLDNAFTIFHKQYDIESILKEFGYEEKGNVEEETTTASATLSTSQQRTNPSGSSTSINPVTSTVTTSFVKPSSISSPVQSIPTASPIPSSTVTIKSTTVTSPASNPLNSTAVTTIDGTTPKSNHALRRQSSNTVIYIVLPIILSHLLFLL